MPRLPRISPIGIPVHLIQRGNNRQACFVSEEDHGAYAGWLKEMAFGNDRFKDELATLTGRRLKPKKRGRPVGWRKEKN